MFCSFCGKVLSKEFNYCPFCGTTCKDVLTFENIVKESFDSVEKVNLTQGLHRLERLESHLVELEEELTAFLSIQETE
ncbi:MAG: hypothetical protein DRP87_08165 [Spirochaetes bacterium]|nr:MAG: hypothetical protein DRP87_08165 [Spirochaetota bacterium]